jgi:hypothetical protein
MMDVYHEDSRDSIAVDQRIEKVSAFLGLSFCSYAEHEQFYLDIAKEAGLEGWKVDRFCFGSRMRSSVE